jgi:hypothetical protein
LNRTTEHACLADTGMNDITDFARLRLSWFGKNTRPRAAQSDWEAKRTNAMLITSNVKQ